MGGGTFYSNHALESDDKEESEYASRMIILSLSSSLPATAI